MTRLYLLSLDGTTLVVRAESHDAARRVAAEHDPERAPGWRVRNGDGVVGEAVHS